MAESWFEAALTRHQGPLLRYAARFLGSEERGRDVTQEAFLRLWRRHADGEPALPENELAPWLYTVGRNLALDILRKEKRMVPFADGRGDELPAAVVSIPTVVSTLAGLPAKEQEVLRLKFQSGLSYKDIAQVTGLSVSNVGWLIHQGIKTLRKSHGGKK